MHGDVARREAMGIVPPTRLIPTGKNELQYRHVTGQRVIARLVKRRTRKRGGIEDECDIVLDHQRTQRVYTQHVLQRGQRQRQRIHATCLKDLAQMGKGRGVAGLQVGAVEQHQHAGRTRLPVVVPGGNAAQIVARVEHGHGG
ncbi:hypothetical protein SDC9_144703 [bioreactor metagenome]|uniref:Uncharacterized protein n=1 Tax=bioreactor metagenome TaxID=1076179 RepID=A0A645E7X6_9ZZZZ